MQLLLLLLLITGASAAQRVLNTDNDPRVFSSERRSRGPPASKSLPAWTVLATGDKAAGTDVIRSTAERARATITEAEGSHVIMVSPPEAVAKVILTAAAAVGQLSGAAAG
jgi:hypothetical protein